MAEKKSTTRSIERSLDILECFLSNENALSLMEISEKTDLSPSTSHRILNSLLNRHYLERNSENKKFFLGSTIAKLGNISLKSIDRNFKEIARPYMIELRDKYNENSSLYIRDGKYKICIERIQSKRSLRQIINIGDRISIFKGSVGKIFLAYMEDSKQREFLDGYDYISAEDLQKIKEKGYAFSDGEREEGLVGLASPIFDIEGHVIGVLSLSGPSIRFLNEELTDKINDVISTAKEISFALGYEDKEINN